MLRSAFLAIAIMMLSGAGLPPNPEPAKAPAIAALDPENVLYLDVGSPTRTYGRVIIKMRPDLAPKHCERIKALVRRSFYDGVPFHRVIAGFMAQTGDRTGTGAGRSDLPDLEPEFTDTPHYRGIVSMARAEAENSANSQFFIMLNDKPQLNKQYTVWGEVVGGMKFMDQIKKGDAEGDGAVAAPPDRIVKMRVAADVKG